MDKPEDVVVIGAGAVGLAAARALAMAGREVLILESQQAFGTGVSSRNSEVLHAGLYYPPGSLKAQLCVRGRVMLLDFAQQWRVPHRLTGKLVVATEPAEVHAIEGLFAQGQANGVGGLELLNGTRAQSLEPALRAVAALYSPATGIIDSHALMTALLGQAQAHGAQLALCSPVLGGEVLGDGSLVLEVGGHEPMRLHARTVVNAAGLTAPALASRIRGVPLESVAPVHFCKGHYFSLQGRSPFSRLVYPVQTSAGLGTHLTLDLGGQARFGPDVQWLQAQAAAQACVPDALGLDYSVDESRRQAFERDIRRYWPGLPEGALLPAYSGIRPKTVGPGAPAGDFIISAPAQTGVAGWLGLYGIESPGLTACMAIGEAVAKALR
ncbi:MAG: NAD(P)/FAD-dependent oxidoreductase [Betaproteobacteria bacterium]|nr:NAD(P)/FAD-dependent oxidoreductase [Betaproteobacteria bacterium]